MIDKYEQLSADRSALIGACKTSECINDIKANTIAMDDPVAKKLVEFFQRSVSYDMVGLLTGDLSKVATPSQGLDRWGSTYVTDDQVMFAKKIELGVLTPEEQAAQQKWHNDTDWMERAVGHELSDPERAEMLVNLGTTALTENWGRGANGAGAETTGKGSKTPSQDGPAYPRMPKGLLATHLRAIRGGQGPSGGSGQGTGNTGAKGNGDALDTPRFITDSAGNTVDIAYTKGLSERV